MIGLFEVTLQQVVLLAVLMPVVASMGGISGSQTLTLIVRGLALGQITESNLKALLIKELKSWLNQWHYLGCHYRQCYLFMVQRFRHKFSFSRRYFREFDRCCRCRCTYPLFT